MKHSHLAATAVVLALGLSGVAQASTFDFSTPVTLSPTAAPGAWYTDRYAPAVFQSPVTYGGRSGTLLEATSPADGANSRPAAFSSGFYNTQGRAYDLAPGTTSMSIDLYIDPSYAGAGTQRLAGFWGVGVDADSGISAYPIIELDRIDGQLSFQGWDTNAGEFFTLSTIASDVALGTWATLKISVIGFNAVYNVNDKFVGAAGAYPSVGLKSAILQVHNNADGITDVAHWSGGAVPEPSTWALMIAGFGGVGAMLRRRRLAGTGA